MLTAQVLLGVSLFALLLVNAHGFSAKGLNYKGQSGFSDSGDLGGSTQGLVTGYAEPGFYSTSGGSSQPIKWEKRLGPPQYGQVQTVPVMLSSAMPGPGYAASGGSLERGSVDGSYQPIQSVSSSFMPLPVAYAVGPPHAGNQANLPEMEWVIAPQAFDEVTTNSQPQGASITGPPLAPAPPALLSGETSNVVKQAELGKYQQQTEEFGYLDNMSHGPAIPPVARPGFGVGGLLGASFYTRSHPFAHPEFKYRVLYGLHPLGPWHSKSMRRVKIIT